MWTMCVGGVLHVHGGPCTRWPICTSGVAHASRWSTPCTTPKGVDPSVLKRGLVRARVAHPAQRPLYQPVLEMQAGARRLFLREDRNKGGHPGGGGFSLVFPVESFAILPANWSCLLLCGPVFPMELFVIFTPAAHGISPSPCVSDGPAIWNLPPRSTLGNPVES